MKKIITYILLFAYTTSTVMPVLPYATDALAHTFWLYQHISTVHYENGNYHSHYEAATIAKKTSTEKQNDTSKLISFATEHIPAKASIDYCTPILLVQKTTYKQLQLYYPNTAYSIETPPPDC